jgi:DNA replication protein DnaC
MTLAHAKLQELCLNLGLDTLAQDFAGVAERAAKEEQPYTEFLEAALRVELQARLHRNRAMMTRVAGFPAIKTLEDYDFGFATGAPRALLQELAGLAFVERANNVVLLGPSGVGKTHPPSPWATRPPRPASAPASSPRPTSSSSSRPPSARVG